MLNPRRCNRPKYTWKEAVNDPRLGPSGYPPRLTASTVRQIAIAVYDRMDADGVTSVSAGTIATQTCRSLRTVRAALEHLETTGWLDVLHSSGRHRNTYRAVLPPLIQAAVLNDSRIPADGVSERWKTLGETLGKTGLNGGGPPRLNGGGPPPLTVAAGTANGGGPPPLYREREEEVDPTSATAATVVDLAAWRAARATAPDGFTILTARPPSDASMPADASAWFYVWAFARTTYGEDRRFPQEREDDRPPLPMDEYLRYEAAWRGAGCPSEIHPAHLLFKPAAKEQQT